MIVVCLFCDEEIRPEERAEDIRAVDVVDGEMVVREARAHVECVTRQGVGGPAHWLGTCTCQGGTDDPDMGMTPRQSALWVWDHLQRLGGPEESSSGEE